MVCRPEFDNQLVRQNLAHANFTFIDGCRVRDITYDRRFQVRTDRAVLTGSQVIGADGAHSIVNRLFRISVPRRVATAIEVNIEGSGPSSEDVPCFDYGAIERGYGWVFPKDDHCSVGLYTLSSKIRNIRAQLLAYIASKRLQPRGNPLADLEAARLPVGGFRLQVPPCPVYVVGDAGGFADALTGEGIYSALESGRLAAEIAVDVAGGRGDHRAYYRRLWRPVLSDTTATFLAAREFYRNVDRGIRILQSPLVWRPLVQGGAAAATFCGSFLKAGLYLPSSLARGSVVRRSGWEQPT
jgi:flavin-dependent dehydrogenase